MPKLNAFSKPKGWIEVITGPMFSGKSEELLRNLNRLKFADISFVLFKPKLDTRTKKTAKSRDGRVQQAINIKSSSEIVKLLSNMKVKPQVVAIDEAQFLDDDLSFVCDQLADQQYIVYVTGLDTDFRGEPFNNMMRLMSIAEKVTKLTAICTECGAPATRTQRLLNDKAADYNSPRVVIGDSDSYCARCRHHHIVVNKPKKNVFL